MKDYNDFTGFLKSVEDNSLSEIKFELSNMVILLKGNEQKINDAITFAKTNSNFNFETHQPSKPNIKLDTNKAKFSYEKGELLNNFSKERLDEVLRLYPLWSKENDNVDEPNQDDSPDSENNKAIKNVAVVVGVALGAYLLYKLLK